MKHDICLVSCGKLKRSGTHQARDLYLGDLTRKQFCYAEHMCKDWYILSAKYGLVAPTQIIASYQLRIEDIDDDALEQWTGVVSRQLERAGIGKAAIITGFAPSAYLRPLMQKGWIIEQPLRGYGIWKRLAFFANHGCRPPHYRMGDS